jgi:hypothetical protein
VFGYEHYLADWWISSHRQVHMDYHKGFDCFVVLIVWHLWKEHNERVLDKVSP